MPSDKTIAFLFGSGISIPADMPSTGKITERVISGEGIIRNTDETYSFNEHPNGKQDECVPRVIGFLKRLEVWGAHISLDLLRKYQFFLGIQKIWSNGHLDI